MDSSQVIFEIGDVLQLNSVGMNPWACKSLLRILKTSSKCARMKIGIRDACSTADIIDESISLLVVYMLFTSGLVVPQNATVHHRMLLKA